MAKKSAVRVTPSTGNVFRDLGFSKEESEHLLVRADLLIQVQRAIALSGLKQAEAAKVLQVTQPRVSDLLRGRIDLFSTDALIDMLARLGVGVRLVVKTRKPNNLVRKHA
jgi:predicted XRE-type DNA-binding protein